VEASAFGRSPSIIALNKDALILNSDRGGNFVNIHGPVIKYVMAAVAKRQRAALAQQCFRNFNVSNIFFVDIEIAFAAPFDEDRLRDEALDRDVEHGIVDQPMIGYSQLAIVFSAVGWPVDKKPGIDRGFARFECDFHTYLSFEKLSRSKPNSLWSRPAQLI
jgi:hypothetical protein